MKRNFSCNDSLTHFLSHPLEGEMKVEEECIYDDEGGQIGDKKRRLSNHQVKSLEKIFEIDNKLDPERKVKVAEDLGLQPRQVAIWFQNRRARWKTKQLERDYTLLKSNYDALNLNYHKLKEEKETIIKQLVELKAKLPNETIKRNEEFDNNEKAFFLESNPTNTNDEPYTHLNYENHQQLLDLKDGFSDSDSSGVLNEENITASNLIGSPLLNMASFGISSLCSSSAMPLNNTETSNIRTYQSDPYLVSHAEDESCNIFLVDQAPNLCWYFQDHRTTG